MLADELTELIAQAGLGVRAMAVHPLWRALLVIIIMGARRRRGKRTDLFNRADADAIRLAQGTIDRPGFRHAHLGSVDQRRDVGGICIAVTHESADIPLLESDCLEDPTARCRI